MLCAFTLAKGCVSKQTYNAEVQTANTYAALNQKVSTELSSDQARITCAIEALFSRFAPAKGPRSSLWSSTTCLRTREAGLDVG